MPLTLKVRPKDDAAAREVAVERAALTGLQFLLALARGCYGQTELAQRSSGVAMSPKQEKAIYFPICEDSDAFEDFLGHKHRAGMFGEHEVKALRCAQPFALREEFAKRGVSLPTTEAEEYKINELARLERLNNLDKHRYLPLLGWHFSIAYGIKDGPIPNRCRLQRLVAFSDGDVIGQAMRSGPGPDPVGNLKIEMDLTLAEDPGTGGSPGPFRPAYACGSRAGGRQQDPPVPCGTGTLGRRSPADRLTHAATVRTSLKRS